MFTMIIKSLIVATLIFYSSTSAQKIIFLNGTTTSGKSSIAKELENLLVEKQLDVAIVAIDSFIVPAILKELAWRWANSFFTGTASINLITPDEMKEIALNCRKDLCFAVQEAYSQGKTVIIDDVMYRQDQIDFYNEAFQGFNVYKVLVYCPISTLINRVIQRNNASGLTEQRSVYQALDQFSNLYKKEGNRQLGISVLSRPDLESACSKALDEHRIMQSKIPDILKGVQNAICPFSIDQIKQSMLDTFAFNNYREVIIGPSLEYNCIVNTETNDGFSCAKKIMDSLEL